MANVKVNEFRLTEFILAMRKADKPQRASLSKRYLVLFDVLTACGSQCVPAVFVTAAVLDDYPQL